MKSNEKILDRIVNILIGNPDINTKEKIILDRYYNSGDSFSKRIRDFKIAAWKLKLKEGEDYFSDDFYKFYKVVANEHPKKLSQSLINKFTKSKKVSNKES